MAVFSRGPRNGRFYIDLDELKDILHGASDCHSDRHPSPDEEQPAKEVFGLGVLVLMCSHARRRRGRVIREFSWCSVWARRRWWYAQRGGRKERGRQDAREREGKRGR